jgi:hypothetical protein
MTLALKTLSGGIGVLSFLIALAWFADLHAIKQQIFVNQIVKMRVAPERLSNPRTQQDNGVAYSSSNIITPDIVRLSARENPASKKSGKAMITNHAPAATRHGAVEGPDGVPAQAVPPAQLQPVRSTLRRQDQEAPFRQPRSERFAARNQLKLTPGATERAPQAERKKQHVPPVFGRTQHVLGQGASLPPIQAQPARPWPRL